MKFRKRPIIVDAVQLTWANWSEICEFVPKPWFVEGVQLADGRIALDMMTLESERFRAVEGDWIVRGVSGEFYPCKPSIFEVVYEAIS